MLRKSLFHIAISLGAGLVGSSMGCNSQPSKSSENSGGMGGSTDASSDGGSSSGMAGLGGSAGSEDASGGDSGEAGGVTEGGAAGADATDASASGAAGAGGEAGAVDVGLPYVTALSVGDAVTCALYSDHTVKCAGDNSYLQLGSGGAPQVNSKPVAVANITNAVAISTGENHSCALLSDTTVKCWGGNGGGQLGNGLTMNSGVPVTVTGLTGVKKIAAGAYFSCAILLDGTVKCWGDNISGALGNGTSGTATNSPLPLTVPGLANVIDLALGDHACALLSDHTAKCWGHFAVPKATTGAMSSVLVPTLIDGMTNIAVIAPESLGDCLLFTDGTAKCIGDDDYGQFGSDQTTTVSVKTWVDVTGLTGASWIGISASGVYIHGTACALLAVGTVECWGYNNHGNAGIGVSSLSVALPAPVLNLENVAALSVGGINTCALLSDHSVKCWGSSATGSTADNLSPTTMPW